jgi:hypothetical protein
MGDLTLWRRGHALFGFYQSYTLLFAAKQGS